MSDPLESMDVAALLRAAEQPARARAEARQTAFRRLFVPVFLLLAALPWLAGTATWASLFICLWAVWFAEQLHPARREWNARPFSQGLAGWRALAKDFVYLFGVTRLTAWLVGAVEPRLTAGASALGLPALWPAQLPLPARIALAFLLIELASYWVHRAAHHFSFLWQFHSTHHALTELNGFKSVRTHPFDNAVFFVARLTPLLLLGAGAEEVAAAAYLGGALGILSHANLPLEGGVFGWVVNLPGVHALHHSADLAQARGNYGCHTVLWDRVFGTLREGGPAPAQLGLEGGRPRTLWQELAWPLYRSVRDPI